MLAEQFGVPLDHVTIHHGDTVVVKQGIGTVGNRSQAVGGATLQAAGAKVKTKMTIRSAATSRCWRLTGRRASRGC